MSLWEFYLKIEKIIYNIIILILSVIVLIKTIDLFEFFIIEYYNLQNGIKNC